MKLTPWFHKSRLPKRIGEYEFRYLSGYKFRVFFDGCCFVIHDVNDLYWWDRKLEADGEWRGLAKDPNA